MKYNIKTYVEAKTGKVFLAITYGGKRFYAFTGLSTTEKFSGVAFPSSEKNHIAKTRRLVDLYSSIEEHALTNPAEQFELFRDNVKRLIKGDDVQEEKGLLYYFDEYANTKAKESTKEVFMTTKRRIMNYDPHCTFDSIDRRWLESYFANEYKRGRKVNGIGIDLRNIRTVFNWAIDNDITTKYPFRKFQIKTERERYLYLNVEEMREFRDIEVEPFMEKYRDLFMLGFYLIGINISDLLDLPANCIKNGRIKYRRNKTARLYDIKVEPEAMEIINKYRGASHLINVLDDGTKKISFSRKLNDYIKRVGPVTMVKNKRGALIKKDVCPLFPDIVWYTARRSWATIAAELDIPKETIGKALGHSEWDSTTTDLYINFDNRKIDEANRMVIDYLNKDNS